MKPSFRSQISLLLAVVFLFFIQNIAAQTINYEPPEDFFVCGLGSFEITISNDSGTPLNNVEVTVDFATSSGADCGLAYLESTVQGASEADITNLGVPIFSVADLAAGESATFTFEVEAPCSVVGCIDGAEIFINEISLDWDGGSTSIFTDPYDIERALLVITSIEQPFMSGSQGDVLLRKITIVNSRPGALQNFLFTDEHQGGIEISSALGTVISPPGNTFQLSLAGPDFTTIGDGDELFEQNEVIVITEQILIADCGVDVPSTVSNLSVGWGCGGETCQEVLANAIITIDESVRVPELVFQPLLTSSECFCGPDGYQQGMVISNEGDGPALDLALLIFEAFPINGYLIDSVSIYVDSAGMVLPIPPVISETMGLPPPCEGPGSLVSDFTVTIPELGAGESLTVYFDVYFCETRCSGPAVDWWYDYSYFKPCPPNPFVELEDPIRVFEIGNNIVTDLDLFPEAPLQDDSTYTATYELTYDSLSLLTDTLALEIILPCGMAWSADNDLILDGQMPLDFNVEVGDTFTVVTANYVLPFTSNTVTTDFEFLFDCESICFEGQVCKDSIETTCSALDSCTVELPQGIGLEITTTLRKCPDFPLNCNMQDCITRGWDHECPVDSFCIQQPPGYVTYTFEAARKNYGLADNDDDRFADGTGGADLSLVERHRLIAGDTITADVRGEVVIDIPGATLPYGNVTFDFVARNLSVFNNDALLKNGSGIQEAGVLIRIFDNSSGSYFDCSDPAAIVDEAGLLLYTYDVSAPALGACLPANFEFAQGDSIIAIANYRIEHNLSPDADVDPLRAELYISPDVFVFDQDTTEYEPIACGCPQQIFELSGYQINILPGQFAIPGCEPSMFAGGSLFRLALHQGNFFPFEHRNLLTALDWQIDIAPALNINLLEANLTFLRFQDSLSNLEENVPLMWTGANPYIMDLEQFQPQPLDEGFFALFQYVFDADCDIFGSNPIRFTTNLDFAPGLPEDQDPLEYVLQSNSLRALVPNLSANAVNCDIISFNDQLVFDFSFANFPTLVAAQSSGDAANTWMYVTSPSGLVTDFQLIDLLTGTDFPQVNGVFQLGDFPIDTIELRLVAQNNSCETEQLELHYGWNCDPFNSQVQTPCYEQVKPLSIFSPPGEIDFFVESPTGCFDLCDTIDYHSLEIFNAQLGAVYDLTASGLLPPGLVVLPGSSQVEYPTGSGQFFPIGDPTSIPGGVVEWPLAELFDSLAMGLPGIGFAPQNSITLQFLTSTSCDFVAEAFSLFAITAEQVCGIPSNTVAKASDPICVNGVSQPYSTSISLEADPGFGCADVVTFDVSLTATEDLPAGANITVSLPAGVLYTAGSCTPICQADFDCSPTFDGNSVTWTLPEGVAQGQLICFAFATAGWSNLGCEQGQILVRSTNETQALCAATGMMCSTQVQTGALIFPFDIQRPEFELENFTVTASQSGLNDVIDFSIDVVNQGEQNEPPIVVDFYIDTDGDGIGDDLTHTENVVATLSSGQSETVTGSFEIPAGNLCNLVAYLDPLAQCACAADSAYVVVPIVYQTEQMPTICSGDEIEIGVAEMPGFTYQWSPADCLLDELGATTLFSCANDEALPVTYDFTLSETDGATCEINNLISVTVQPVPGIAFADSPICQGQSANIAATIGASYQWSGPGVMQDVQVQTVMPSATTTYSVTVTDDFGCSGEESVEILVNLLPTANAGDDIVVCPGQTAQLNAPEVSGLDYLWSPAILSGAPALSNPSIPDPIVLTNETTSFTLTVTDENGCSASDIAVVDFNGSFDLILPADLTICLGSSTTLTASGGDTYVWSPSSTCLDPPACSSIEVMPIETTTYTVEATSADGCMANGSVTVTVSETEILVNLDPIQICEGETVVIFEMEVSEPGTYFDTIVVAGIDCDTIFAQNLLVNPSIDTTIVSAIICEGESFVFENMEVSETGLTCVDFPMPSGCDSTICLDLAVLDTPQFTLIIEPDTIGQPGDEIMLSIEPSTFDSIVWMGGNIGDECLNLPTCEDVLGEENANYSVTVFDGICSGDASQLFSVAIECDPALAELPNVFTPNGDGTNDVFTIVSPDAEEVLNMRIWNRWGQKVYDGPGPWDGTQEGEQAASDVYIYLVRVGCPVQVEADERVLKGDVTLLR